MQNIRYPFEIRHVASCCRDFSKFEGCIKKEKKKQPQTSIWRALLAGASSSAELASAAEPALAEAALG